MGDRGRQLAHGSDAVGMRELEFRLAVSLLVFASFSFCRPQCRNIRAGAAITAEFSVGVKHWLAADFIINHRSVAMCGPVGEIAERLTRLEHRPMKLPLFRLRLDVRCEFPSGHPNPARSREAASETSFVLREACEFVIRIGFPVPIGGAFRVVSEFRFALPQSFLSALELINIQIHPDPSQYGSIA